MQPVRIWIVGCDKMENRQIWKSLKFLWSPKELALIVPNFDESLGCLDKATLFRMGGFDFNFWQDLLGRVGVLTLAAQVDHRRSPLLLLLLLHLQQFLLVVRPWLPFLDIAPSGGKLHIIYVRNDISQLFENWHDDILDKAWLSTRNLCGLSVAHHGHFQPLGLLGIALVEELVEQEISPGEAYLELPQVGWDIAGVQQSIRH